MYHTPIETRKAQKRHLCTNCGEPIEIGTEYARWASYDDGKAFANKMHQECLADLQDDAFGGSFEYTLYGGERPNSALDR